MVSLANLTDTVVIRSSSRGILAVSVQSPCFPDTHTLALLDKLLQPKLDKFASQSKLAKFASQSKHAKFAYQSKLAKFAKSTASTKLTPHDGPKPECLRQEDSQ